MGKNETLTLWIECRGRSFCGDAGLQLHSEKSHRKLQKLMARELLWL